MFASRLAARILLASLLAAAAGGCARDEDQTADQTEELLPAEQVLRYAASADAAVILNLLPGVYNAVVTGANGSSGAAIIEIYEIPNP